MSAVDALPPNRLDVALKEWEVVCDLLADGRQILLLRKGGIQEGKNRFEIAHRHFALLPTRSHQQPDMLKPVAQHRLRQGKTEPEAFHLTHGATITDILSIRERARMDRLEAFHCWAEPYIDMRFNYRPERPLYLLMLRVFALVSPVELKNTWEVAGCRSWVPLPEPAQPGEAVMADGVYGQLQARIRDAVEG